MSHKRRSWPQVCRCYDFAVVVDVLLFVDSPIINSTDITTPDSSEQIQSEGPAQYVLETPAGFADSHGLIAGGWISWKHTN